MPTPRTGDPTATQAPSAKPGPGVFPTQNLPADSDPPNAATFGQAYKVVADFVAWQADKFATLGSWAQQTERWRNARLQTRSAIDHFGFRNGNVIEWNENWTDNDLQFITANGVTVTERWTYYTDGSAVLGGNLNSRPPKYTGDNVGSRFLSIGSIPGGGRADIKLNAAWNTAVFTDDITAAMWWSFLLQPVPTTDCTFVMGFTSNFEPANAITDGCYIFKTPTDVNWQFTSRSVAGGGYTTADTGIPAGSGDFHTAGIVLVGANQSDDSTAHALLFIDGVMVTDITTYLPYTTGSALPLSPIFGVVTTAGAATVELLIGSLRYRQSMFVGDSFI